MEGGFIFSVPPLNALYCVLPWWLQFLSNSCRFGAFFSTVALIGSCNKQVDDCHGAGIPRSAGDATPSFPTPPPPPHAVGTLVADVSEPCLCGHRKSTVGCIKQNCVNKTKVNLGSLGHWGRVSLDSASRAQAFSLADCLSVLSGMLGQGWAAGENLAFGPFHPLYLLTTCRPQAIEALLN